MSASSKPIIAVEGLGKEYTLRRRNERYETLRGALVSAASAPLRLLTGRERPPERHWALRDVSFSIDEGEVVGVVGRNGAGKSTLLKILSRITDPTTGRAVLRGRTSSLLEVGTGFHPELSGRDNIFLNGALLGMSRREIKRKFDEIVAFADVERFIDTPAKHYSSGMYMRLAFAVAAHLEPEILIVDEVLAVGDAAFQKKCVQKMEDVGKSGRTVLFVSHNMPLVARLCPRCLLLEDGALKMDGRTAEVTHAYLSAGQGSRATRSWSDARAPGNHVARLRGVRVHDEQGHDLDTFDIRKPIGIEMTYDVLRDHGPLAPNLHVFNDAGVCLFITHDTDAERRREHRAPGRYVSTAWIPGNLLAEGTIIVGVALSTFEPLEVHFWERDCVAFQVVDPLEGDSARGEFAAELPGVVRPLLEWTMTRQSLEPQRSSSS